MKNRICMVTGATNGIGRATAEGLARLGATVVVVGRNRGKVEATVAALRQTTGNSSVEMMVADFVSMEQVRRLAQQFRSRYDRLHVLVNNAGLWVTERGVSKEGYELTFAVNHLAAFLLTNLLLDAMKASTPARIVNVSSRAHFRGRIDFADLQSENHYSGWACYANSKLANVLFTSELASRLRGTAVTANSLHPGVVATGLFDGQKGVFGLLLTLAKPFFITSEQGARTCIYLAASPEVEGVSGRYFVNCREAPTSPAAQDEQTAKRLWQVSERLTGLTT
ncbi:MAG: SDR family oxidoreductase [Acidobacteria bacterium]|nr:SDR family oxidoreductase [Acidobacteriota bacterium]